MASEERPRASRAVAHLLLMQPAAHREPVEARHRRVLARTGVCTASLGRCLQMNLKLQTCMKHSESICTVGNGLLVSGTAITATSAGSRTPSSSGCTLQRCVMGFVRCLLRASAHSVNTVCMSTAKVKATLCSRNRRQQNHASLVRRADSPMPAPGANQAASGARKPVAQKRSLEKLLPTANQIAAMPFVEEAAASTRFW